MLGRHLIEAQSPAMTIDRRWIEKLLYGDDSAVRFTQDSPVLPDVWIAFAEEPSRQHDLLLTPQYLAGSPRGGPRRLAKELRERLELDPGDAATAVKQKGEKIL